LRPSWCRARMPTVIAINGCRLADWSIDDDGISRMPLAVEATFPVSIRELDKLVEVYELSSRFKGLRDPAGAQIFRVGNTLCGDLFDDRILATVGLTRKIFGSTKEYVADDQGDEYLLRPLSEPPR
jgi:hypothetical protein